MDYNLDKPHGVTGVRWVGIPNDPIVTIKDFLWLYPQVAPQLKEMCYSYFDKEKNQIIFKMKPEYKGVKFKL